MTESVTLEVGKEDWARTRLVREEIGELTDNEVLLAVDRQALTANNISYAAAGDLLGYWGFFPAEEGWGRIPAMGWADVVESRHPGVRVGERVWGFFPLTTHLKVLAGEADSSHFMDTSPHRADYAPVYARFDFASANPIYEPAREDHDSLLRGLYLTSWLVEDFLAVGDFYGAESCVITSASSKTSIALAHRVKQRGVLRTVALTSSRNRAFCESLGYYDDVVLYDAIDTLDASTPVVMVDMAGSAPVITAAHNRFGDNMKYSCQVGATHYDEGGAVDGLPGAKPEFFFAPGHIETRSAEIGAGALMLQLGTDYVGFRADSDAWLDVVRSRGPENVESAYRSVLAGAADPRTGQIVSMSD